MEKRINDFYQNGCYLKESVDFQLAANIVLFILEKKRSYRVQEQISKEILIVVSTKV